MQSIGLISIDKKERIIFKCTETHCNELADTCSLFSSNKEQQRLINHTLDLGCHHENMLLLFIIIAVLDTIWI